MAHCPWGTTEHLPGTFPRLRQDEEAVLGRDSAHSARGWSDGGVPLDTWLKLAAEGDPEGGLEGNRGQRYFTRPESEYELMDEALRTVENGKQPSYIVSGETRDEL